MADVTISELQPGIPTSSDVIPFSTGSTTQKALASNFLNVIKQIQFNNYDGYYNTASTAIQEVVGFNVSITPTSTNSRVIIYISGFGGSSFGGGGNADSTYTGLLGYVYRYTLAGGNVLLPLNPTARQTNDRCHLVFSSSSQYDITACTLMLVDQPNTTNTVTYKIFARAEQNGYNGFINCSGNGATGPSARSWIYAVEF